ncbi:MAG: hypothetical protein ACYCZN_09075 [Candidatus Dormibacteria bacterium]
MAKGGLYEEAQAEFQADVARLSQLAARQLIEPSGLGLEVAELAIRTAMLKLGSGLLERVLDLDPGHRGPEVTCGGGHRADFRGYRELGIQGSSLSPGLGRTVARVGSQEPFARAGRDLLALAVLRLTGKRVERGSKADGEKVRAAIESQAEAVIEGKVVPLGSAQPIHLLYVAMDGTGVPTIPADTKGRRGKGEDGWAHTREAKLGCLFTQTGSDEQGCPLRDPASSSYVATMDSAAAFGALLYSEALRRGLHHAEMVVVLGDGAPLDLEPGPGALPPIPPGGRPLPRLMPISA